MLSLVALLALTPVPIQVPSIYGNNAKYYKAIDLLSTPQLDSQGNWRRANAFAADIGIANISDPTRFDPKIIEDAVYYALTHGAQLFVARFHQNVQPIVYQGGKPQYEADGKTYRLTYWGKLEGKPWFQNWRPPETTWKEIGKLHTRFAVAMANGAERAGRKPQEALRIVLFNEPCKGGAGGQHYGSFKDNAYPVDIVDKPDGYIEPEFWRMARTIRYASTLLGIRSYSGLEADKSSVGDVELSCVTGYDCQRFFEGISGYTLQNYARKGSDPANVAMMFGASIQTIFARADANPILEKEAHWAIMESNIPMDRLTTAQKPFVADYRNAIVDRAAQSGLDFCGLFTAYGFSGFDLFRSDWSLVGGPVGSRA